MLALNRLFAPSLTTFMAAFTLLSAGCAREETKPDSAKNATPKNSSGSTKVKKHDHWWCDEHGIPEADCSLCLPNAEVKKRFKDKGDWCKEHERALSQCFICKPERREFYAAQYRDKYGKEPPPIEDDNKKDDKSKKDEKKG